MLFDNFDKKIKEAAEQHHPAYDESAWKKMESLLNLHLPQQKKDRRRIFLVLFTFLAVGGGAFFMVSKPHAGKPAQATNKNETTIDKAVIANKRTAIIQPEIEKINS